jgi:hypothetical protein
MTRQGLQFDAHIVASVAPTSAMEEPTAKPGQTQPWRQFWPPKDIDTLTEAELAKKPWLTWKPDPAKPNAKPWLGWTPRGYRPPLESGRAHSTCNEDQKCSYGDNGGGPDPDPDPEPYPDGGGSSGAEGG